MTLTQTAYVVKRALFGFIGLLVLYIVFTISKPMLYAAYLAAFPPKNPPKTIYGALPQLEFVNQNILPQSNIAYELNTKTGKLPAVPDRMNIYKFIPKAFSYSAGRNAQDLAQVLGFKPEDLITDLKNPTYRWRNATTGSSLEIDTKTDKITLATDFSGKSLEFIKGKLSEQSARVLANDTLNKINRGFTAEEIFETEVALGKFSGKDILEADTFVESQLAKVDFFKKIDDFKILGPNAKQGLIQVYVAYPTVEENTIYKNPKLSFTKYQVDTTAKNIATYPIISPNTAWEAIKQNKGVVSSIVENNKSPFEDYTPVKINKILINEVYLAYYEDTKPQQYLQPIYVFEGNFTGTGSGGKIVLYYPAVAAEYIQSTQLPDQK